MAEPSSLVANEGDGSEGASAVNAFVCFVAPVWDVVMVDVGERWQQCRSWSGGSRRLQGQRT